MKIINQLNGNTGEKGNTTSIC